MKSKTIRIATRQSPLALWQAKHIASLLLKQWPELNIHLVPMTTSGDRFLKDKLLAAGGKGLFVKELEEAMLNDKADIAVHSAKDMPAEFPKGLCLATICTRDNPFDAFVSARYNRLMDLPPSAIVGTSSLRRQSQLLAYRPDLRIQFLRGNINTRLQKLDSGEYDAIILATAGLERMGYLTRIQEQLSTEIMLPACAQGALAIECRTEDSDIQALLAPLHDSQSALCVQTERQVNALLGGNCHVPLAVFCRFDSANTLYLRAKILNADGSQCISYEEKAVAEEASSLAVRCAQALQEQGASTLLAFKA